nr:probable serine/threonine-protein kinase At1g01540 [Ipomoea batatas]
MDTLRELEIATNGFTDENVIGEGGYDIVYSGVLEDNTKVAIKNLFNNRGQAEREFKVEVEVIGRVILMLVYEYVYVNNGNLEQWLHGDVGPYNPRYMPSDLYNLNSAYGYIDDLKHCIEEMHNQNLLMDLLNEAEMALSQTNDPTPEGPNGAAGHYLLGLTYRVSGHEVIDV